MPELDENDDPLERITSGMSIQGYGSLLDNSIKKPSGFGTSLSALSIPSGAYHQDDAPSHEASHERI